MRKMMTKEVVFTKVFAAKMDIVDGVPVAVTLEPETLMGNISIEKAQKLVNKKTAGNANVYKVESETVVYEMSVEDFIKQATPRKETETKEGETA